MKILSIIALILISFSIQNDISGAGRDFFTGLLTVVEGKEVQLDEACLGEEFDADVQHLIDNLREGDLITILGYAGKIFNDITLKCPSSDISQIAKDLIAVGPIELYSRIQKHKVEVLDMLKELFVKGKVTAYSLGEAAGNIINTWVYDKTIPKKLTLLGGMIEKISEFLQ